MRKVYEALGRNLTGKMADFMGERPQDKFLESIPWNMRRVGVGSRKYELVSVD